MQILSVHIENFGKLQNFDLSFDKGTNTILEDNGFGKSTLAAFIKSMFYGLEGARKHSLDENERRRFKPWQGGVYGGTIIFSVHGKTYVLTRHFGTKDADDTFELRDYSTNLISSDYNEKIGEQIFRIDRESFSRTIFIGQNDCATSSTDSINAQMGNLTDNTNDINNFDTATDKLSKIMNQLTPNRVTGSISQRRNYISSLEAQINAGSNITDTIKEYQNLLEEAVNEKQAFSREIKELINKQKEAAGYTNKLEKKENWDKLILDKKEKEDVLAQAVDGIGNIPSLEEIDSISKLYIDYDKKNEIIKSSELTSEESINLNTAKNMFGEDIPDEVMLSKIENDINELAKLRADAKADSMSEEDKSKLEKLSRHFADNEESVSSMISRWQSRNLTKQNIPNIEARIEAEQRVLDEKLAQSKGDNLIIIAGLFLIIVGIISKFAVNSAMLAITFVGVALVIFGAFKKSKQNSNTNASQELEGLKQQLEDNQKAVESADSIIAGFLAKHGEVFEEYSVTALLNKINEDSYVYNSLKEKAAKCADNTIDEKAQEISSSIASFVRKYNQDDAEASFMNSLYTIKKYRESLPVLSQKEKAYNRNVAEKNETESQLLEIISRYGIVLNAELMQKLNAYKDIHANINKLKSDLEYAKNALAEFEENNDIEELKDIREISGELTQDELNTQIDAKNEALEQLQNQIVSYNKKLDGCQEQYDDIEEMKAELENMKELLEIEKKKYNYAKQAKEYLAKAKESLTAKYNAPLTDRFNRYIEILTGEDSKPYHIDANTAVTIDGEGKQREYDYLSQGYKDLIGVVLRVSLIDVMYENESPIIVMDDPFTNLDDKKQSYAREFLAEISKKYQVIYFTCSESRAQS